MAMHGRHACDLVVDSDPQGARVWEKDIGNLGKTPLRTRISWACKHDPLNPYSPKCRSTFQIELHAELGGYGRQSRAVRLLKDSSREVFFTFSAETKPQTYKSKVYIESDPAGAFVTVDGRNMGKTPATIELSWSAGARRTKTVVVQKTGYRDGTKEVTPEDDRIIVVLQPLRASDR